MLILCAALIALLIPDPAWAWGGGMHLQVGLHVLENLSLINPAVAALLTSHPRDFLYGCISADITLGKKYTHYLLHCHRWGIGRKVLQKAQSEAEQACAYGYLCHLAADIVAHNCFVPYKIMQSFSTVTMKHTYWEMRFETFVEKPVWDLAKEICKADQRSNDMLLRNVLTPTIFSFGLNKRIFNSIMLLSRLERWQRVMQTLSDNSRFILSDEERKEYFDLTIEMVYDFLRHPEDSELLMNDPTGERALTIAEAIRKNLRLLYKNGKITKADGAEQVDSIRMKLQKALHNPQLLDQLYSA
jgi:Zinc dependent phospholipase C